MHLRSLTLINWLCYQGEHELTLEPKPYAIVARHQRDAGRSNWLGKTALLEAVRFALDGTHRHRTEDAWLHHGERSGGVRLVFDDGSALERVRVRGKSTQLAYAGAKKDEAQRLLDARVGLDPQDYADTWYFEQGQMARIVKARAAPRMEMVARWFQLGKLEQAEDAVGAKVATASWGMEQVARNAETVRAVERAQLGGAEDVGALQAALAEAEEAHRLAVERRARREADLGENDRRRLLHAEVARYDELVAEGKALAEDLAGEDAAALHDAAAQLDAERQRATTADANATEALRKQGLVADGEFDGVCPVAGIQCPATGTINADRVAAQARLREARKTVAAARLALSDAHAKWREADDHLQRHQRRAAKLEHLRDEVRKLAAKRKEAKQAGRPRDHDELAALRDEAAREAADAAAKVDSIRASLALVARARDEQDRLANELLGHQARVGTLREAQAVLKAAQRRVAEDALGDIEAGANGKLRDAGVELQVAMLWSREGQGLAKACGQCGHPFPKSERVKACERCGTVRGPHYVNKLEVELSNESGAAQDLAGISIQLAAAEWLRADRMAAWAMAAVDEPFGMMDAAHRGALSAHLGAMLLGSGFRQAMVIAHHASVLDALPGRIEVTSDGKCARPRVAA